MIDNDIDEQFRPSREDSRRGITCIGPVNYLLPEGIFKVRRLGERVLGS